MSTTTSDALRLLLTSRLRLVPVTKHNVKVLWRLMRSPHLRQFQDIPRLPFEYLAQRLAARPERLCRGAIGRFEWLVTLKSDVDPLGWVSVRISPRHPTRGELGYSILHEWRGNGYAAEAVRAVIDTMFEAMVVDTLDAYCLPENIASKKVLERIGLTEQQRMRRGAVVRGHSVDVLRYELASLTWRRRLTHQNSDTVGHSSRKPHTA